MAEKLTKTGLVEAVAKKAELDKKTAQKAVDAFVDAMKESLSNGEGVDIRGFGNFCLRRRDERIGHNPRNPKETIKTPAHTIVAFKVGKEVKEAVWSVKIK